MAFWGMSIRAFFKVSPSVTRAPEKCSHVLPDSWHFLHPQKHEKRESAHF